MPTLTTERNAEIEITDKEIIRDEFADASYVDANAKLPRITALRGTHPSTCGYFISMSDLAKAGWVDFEPHEEQIIQYTYETSQNTETGLLIQNPRMLVCQRSELLGYDRKASEAEQKTVILGPWISEYKKDENISNLQIYEIILVDALNNPLHTVPFAYSAKGANGASYSQHWQQLVTQVTACHAIANRIVARPKDARFNALCVFSFQTAREQVGQKQKAFTCRVIGHDAPTGENWRNYFVGYQREIKELAWQSLQPQLPLSNPQPTLTLAGATNTEEEVAF
jgi:hypothetical protein